jgi:hypothetical protein
MTYSQYGLIEATDFNNFVGNATTGISTANTLNSVWGIGIGNTGYGQTGVSQVAQFTTVNPTDWRNLINTTSTIGNHQGTAITNIFPPNSGDLIATNNNILTNLTAIYNSRLNAAAQGTTSSTTTTNSSTWSSAISFTHSVTFASANAARYFFNAGGQIALTFSHPTGSGVNALLNTLATRCGTIVLSSSSCTIAGTSYTGTTKIGGSGTPAALLTSVGFYALTTTNQEIFRQLASGLSPSAYVGTFISVNVRINSLPGTGTIITFTTLFDEVPNGGSTLGLTSGSATTLTVRPPSNAYISDTWGTVSVAGSVTGS